MQRHSWSKYKRLEKAALTTTTQPQALHSASTRGQPRRYRSDRLLERHVALGTPDVKLNTAPLSKEVRKRILHFPNGATERKVLLCLHLHLLGLNKCFFTPRPTVSKDSSTSRIKNPERLKVFHQNKAGNK